MSLDTRRTTRDGTISLLHTLGMPSVLVCIVDSYCGHKMSQVTRLNLGRELRLEMIHDLNQSRFSFVFKICNWVELNEQFLRKVARKGYQGIMLVASVHADDWRELWPAHLRQEAVIAFKCHFPDMDWTFTRNFSSYGVTVVAWWGDTKSRCFEYVKVDK